VVAPAARMVMSGHLGHIVGCAGMEAFSRALASELAPKGIRTVCVKPHAIPEAVVAGSYTGELFAPKAQAAGLSVTDWLGGAASGTLLKRLPTLAEVAETVAFVASPKAASMTAAVVNLTSGVVAD
jgi:3-oxoacyl-[acyl-carrier protein] reductase